ncbi:Fis family transcriptional regulator [Mycobacterium sp.]|uniref:Fis family transcriptional regulator n=1 Tax=Mycobacterium sp. TaxID=1785 RepID=UPI0025DA53FC|nr:Fis family transcriptional regulator [Mycobacterium sp.]
MALDIDIDGFRRTGHHVADAASMLQYTPGSEVPACGADQTSQAIMDNLNSRQKWLNEHLAAGAAQAFHAAEGIDGTATAYQQQDDAGAAAYVGGSDSPAAPSAPVSAAPPAPAAPPMLTAIPSIADQDGEQMATDLEGGAGTGPAIQAAAHWTTIAGKATTANASLAAAHTQLIASGQSQVHGPLMARLTKAMAWTSGIAGHATALAGGYTAAADLHTTTKTAVGSPAVWRGRKEGLRAAQAAGPPGIPVYNARKADYTLNQGLASSAAESYQAGGHGASTPPGTLPDPGLDPNTSGADPDNNPNDPKQQPKDDATKDPDQQSSGMQDILSSMMGALQPLMKAAGNPTQSLGQLGQLAQQAGSLAGMGSKGAAHSPIKPAALSGAHPGAGHGGGGGSPIKGAGLAGVHPASLSGSPAATPASPPAKSAGPAAAAGASGGGAGMMPMGAGAGHGQGKGGKVNPAEAPLPDVDEAGRPGVVGQSAPAKAAPVVDPGSKNAVKERLAARKKNLAGDDG